MPGTHRTKTELMGLFGDDRGAGAITPKDLRDLIESVRHQDDSDYGVLQLVNSDTTTDLNQPAMTEIPFGDGLSVGSGLTRSGSSIITNFEGHIDLSGNVFVTSLSQRPTITCTFFKNETDLGVRYNTDYVRGTGGHNEASCACLPFAVACSPGDVFTLRGQKSSASGTLVMPSAGSSFFKANRLG